MNELTEIEISKLLKELCITPNLYGYRYIKTAMLIMDSMTYISSLGALCQKISESCDNVSVSTINHCINHAIKSCLKYAENDLLYEIFGPMIQNSSRRITNKTFLYLLFEYLKNNKGDCDDK